MLKTLTLINADCDLENKYVADPSGGTRLSSLPYDNLEVQIFKTFTSLIDLSFLSKFVLMSCSAEADTLKREISRILGLHLLHLHGAGTPMQRDQEGPIV